MVETTPPKIKNRKQVGLLRGASTVASWSNSRPLKLTMKTATSSSTVLVTSSLILAVSGIAAVTFNKNKRRYDTKLREGSLEKLRQIGFGERIRRWKDELRLKTDAVVSIQKVWRNAAAAEQRKPLPLIKTTDAASSGSNHVEADQKRMKIEALNLPDAAQSKSLGKFTFETESYVLHEPPVAHVVHPTKIHPAAKELELSPTNSEEQSLDGASATDETTDLASPSSMISLFWGGSGTTPISPLKPEVQEDCPEMKPLKDQQQVRSSLLVAVAVLMFVCTLFVAENGAGIASAVSITCDRHQPVPWWTPTRTPPKASWLTDVVWYLCSSLETIQNARSTDLEVDRRAFELPEIE